MKVLAFGTFDILHKGHIYFLNEAKKFGKELIVVIARDKTVKEIKGKNSKNNEECRVRELEKEGIANKIILGNKSENKYDIIEEIKPDIIVLGYDQNHFTKNLGEELLIRNIKCKIIRLQAYQPDKYKSSIIIQDDT